MRTIDDKFISYRAEQLAIICLTDRDDIRLTLMESDYGLDMLVSILRNGKDCGQFFGVEVKGVISKDKLGATSDKISYVLSTRERTATANIPFPVLLLTFTMDRDEAFWAWLKAPDVRADLKPAEPGGVKLSPLKSEDLDHIVELVIAWYSSRAVTAAA